MSASMIASTTGQDLARNMTPFEIDEALATLVESAQDEAAANGGEGYALEEQRRYADYRGARIEIPTAITRSRCRCRGMSGRSC